MSIVERYYSTIRRVYKIIRDEAAGIKREAVLQMAVRAINVSVKTNGLVPILLGFDALPRSGLLDDAPFPSIFKTTLAL